MKQIPLPIGPDPLATFANYIAGPNAAALQHLQSLVMPSAPVYLWGPPGSGKTHLLRALVHGCQQAGRQVGWFSADDGLPWTLSPDWGLVVIDRAERLDAAAQRAAFALFVEAGTHGVQLAAAGRLPPVDLPLREDLRSRLGWGHVFALHTLTEPETRAVLRREADHRGILLGDDLIDYLLTRFPRDLQHLMRLLDGLDRFALAKGRLVTVPLLRQMLIEEGVPEVMSP
jgi:DnaA-homolog protein